MNMQQFSDSTKYCYACGPPVLHIRADVDMSTFVYNKRGQLKESLMDWQRDWTCSEWLYNENEFFYKSNPFIYPDARQAQQHLLNDRLNIFLLNYLWSVYFNE